MPEHMQRRVAVYYHRRAIPHDLQAILGCREKARSLRTSDFAEAKRRCHIYDVQFDEWVSALRAEQAKTRQMGSAAVGAATVPDVASEENNQEAFGVFADHYPEDEDAGLPYADWLRVREKRDGEADAAYLAHERRTASLPLTKLFEQYAAQPNSRAETVKQFRAVIQHFINFLGHDNALRIRRLDVVKWRDLLREEVGPRGRPRLSKTINDTYLSTVSTVFAFGVDRLLLTQNPAKDVKRLPADKSTILRERDFTPEERQLILRATLNPTPPRMAPHNAAARRWVPWLCAYTGARVNEITQLRGLDVRQIDGVWSIHITPEAGTTKNRRARTVPLHAHLIEQGFLAFVGSSTEPLFYEPSARRAEGGRLQFKKAGMKLAEWVRTLGIGEGVAPNHGWRHTFKTITREVGIPEAAADYIQGHASKSQGRTYGTHNLPTVLAELSKMPRFGV